VGVISISSFTFSDTARAPAVSPDTGPDVESDLVGPLIEYRERDSIILFAEVASYLRAELSTDNDRLRCARNCLMFHARSFAHHANLGGGVDLGGREP